MSIEDDTYSTIFTALKHPIRRKILRILNQTSSTYTDIQIQLKIDNGLLNYHLENMKDLINKSDEGKYGLSEFGKAALSVTEKVEAPAKKSGLSINQQNGVLLILTIAVASLSGLSFLLYSNYMSQGGVLSKKTAELDYATKQLTVLAPLGELASLSKPAIRGTGVEISGVTIVKGFPMSITYRRGGGDGVNGEYDDTSTIIVFYIPSNDSVAKFRLVVDPVNIYDLELTLQRGNAWKNETLVDLGTFAKVYNYTEIDEFSLKHVWQAPIMWSLKTHGTGVMETPSLAKGWYTFSMFGPIVFRGSDLMNYPSFGGARPSGRIGLNGVSIDSYKAFIDVEVIKAGEQSLFAVTTDRS